MMSFRGVIFDFNGTLFWDTEYQERSWDEYLILKNRKLSENEKKEFVHGRNAKDTFEFIFQKHLSDDEILLLTEDKEFYYRKECLSNGMSLAPGAVSLLRYLNNRNIPMAIATASGKTNVDFFIDKFKLLDFFLRENIVYNDGKIRGKPNPDIFLLAMERLSILPKDIIIFEDSVSGILAAEKSEAGQVVIVNSTKKDYYTYEHYRNIVIDTFDDFDRTLLT